MIFETFHFSIFIPFVFLIVWFTVKWITQRIFSWLKRKFKVDITISSVGFFTVYDVVIRSNQLLVEIGKLSLKLNLFKKSFKGNFIFVDVGEIRIRADLKRNDQKKDSKSNIKEEMKPANHALIFSYLQNILKYCNFNIDILNMMFLNLFLPDSLLHINLKQIEVSAKTFSNQFFFSLQSINGKLLQSSSRHNNDGNSSCLAEVTSQMEVELQLACDSTKVELLLLNVISKYFQVEVFEGSLVPGILLPRHQHDVISVPNVDPDRLEKTTKSALKKIISILPRKSNFQINNFRFSFYGDETMGESTRGANISVSSIIFSQCKDTDDTIEVLNEQLPIGFVKLQIDDVTMTDYDKHQVAKMGKSRLECKLNAKSLLSCSLDLTSWHADYKHRESVEFWKIIINKIKESKKTQKSTISVPQSTVTNFSPRLRRRLVSVPSPSEELLSGYDVTKSNETSNDFLKMLEKVGISVMIEFTLYDATMRLLMNDDDVTQSSSSKLVLDHVSIIVDQSIRSSASNFMFNLDHLAFYICDDERSSGSGGSLDNHLRRKPRRHHWGSLLTIDKLNLHGSATVTPPESDFIISGDVTTSVSVLVEAKLGGVQVELRDELFAVISALHHAVHSARALTSSPNNGRSDVIIKVACLEMDADDVNIFVLPDAKHEDFLVTRIDCFKFEMSDSDDVISDERNLLKRLIIYGVGMATIPNLQTPLLAPSSPRHHTSTRSYHLSNHPDHYYCCDARQLRHHHLCVDVIEFCHSLHHIRHRGDVTPSHHLPNQKREWKPVKREIATRIESEDDVIVEWSPWLHITIHDVIKQVITYLSPEVKSEEKKPLTTKNSKRWSVGCHGDYNHMTTVQDDKLIGNHGDQVPVLLDLNISRIRIRFEVDDDLSVVLVTSKLRCEQNEEETLIKSPLFQIVMDDFDVFTFTDVDISLLCRDPICDQHREEVGWEELKTRSNRCWKMRLSSLDVTLPHKYDFASTVDHATTCFKWAKQLYKKSTHPFGSVRLPPDLQLVVNNFRLELEDSDFECRLRDNYRLMVDESEESEKRRKVLDERISEIRRSKGELIPALKVEYLYCKLAERSIRIYLDRSKKMYETPLKKTLVEWTLQDFNLTVLCDKKFHGIVEAMKTIQEIDSISPFPFSYHNQMTSCSFVTLWCRYIVMTSSRHQVRVRDYSNCLMDYQDWSIKGKFCASEQRGPISAQRTEYVKISSDRQVAVKRNMPPLKFYYDLNSHVTNFHMSWGPCWEPAWAQVNLGLNLLTKESVDPSVALPWWDKSRLLLHGTLRLSTGRANLLHLASRDPYNVTEHVCYDWKLMAMTWKPGNFTFTGDLDVHIRTASKYDDVRFLHLSSLRLECPFRWLCSSGHNPQAHHDVIPTSRSDDPTHDSFRNFRSSNIDLTLIFDTCRDDDVTEAASRDLPEILVFSSSLRWLRNFVDAINAIVRPIRRGKLFTRHQQQRVKLKLSRHYNNVNLYFNFPQLRVFYWSSCARTLGVELGCGEGEINSRFNLKLVPFKGTLRRRPMTSWSVYKTTCNLNNTKIYLLQRNTGNGPMSEQKVERCFLLSLSHMRYKRDNQNTSTTTTNKLTGANDDVISWHDNLMSAEFDDNDGDVSSSARSRLTSVEAVKRHQKSSNTKQAGQSGQTLTVHDLRAMWSIQTRAISFGLYEAYEKASVLRQNLKTNILRKFGFRANDKEDTNTSQSTSSTPDSNTDNVMTSSRKTSTCGKSPNFRNTAGSNLALDKFLKDDHNRFAFSEMELQQIPQDSKDLLKGKLASEMNDVIARNWCIRFVNCQAMLKGPKTRGYMILTAAQAEFLNRQHQVSWRDGQLTTKSTWTGSLTGTQVFATVDRNATSSDEDDDNVPWLATSDIAPRGPSPGMLDINELMTSGQAVGGVVGDGCGVSAGSFQLQRIMSRCSCRMFYVSYEQLVDTEHIDQLAMTSPQRASNNQQQWDKEDLLRKETPTNVLTILQDDQLEICTNTSQYNMILDIVENLILYVEPVMRDHRERVERMKFALRLTSSQDAMFQQKQLTTKQNLIRSRKANLRKLEKHLHQLQQEKESDGDEDLTEKKNNLLTLLKEEKEAINEASEELGIIIRCFKEDFLERKTMTSYSRNRGVSSCNQDNDDDSIIVRTTEVSFAQVKWSLTDADGQLKIAQFEMRNFFYDKNNKSDDAVSHSFELGWLRLQNLLPAAIYRDVIRPRQHKSQRGRVTGVGGKALSFRVFCKVRSPVGGISVKEHLELNASPLVIQCSHLFFRRLMSFFFPDKPTAGPGAVDEADDRSQLLLGQTRPDTGPAPLTRPNRSRSTMLAMRRRGSVDDVEKMKERAANNNTFLYIKITQVSLLVSYKGEREKNLEDVRDVHVTLPMLEYHSVTWTWHDFAIALKRDCKRQLIQQLVKEKLFRRQHTTNASTIMTSSSPDMSTSSPLYGDPDNVVGTASSEVSMTSLVSTIGDDDVSKLVKMQMLLGSHGSGSSSDGKKRSKWFTRKK